MSGILNQFKALKQRGLAYSCAILFNRVVPDWLFRCRRFVIYQLDTNVAPVETDPNVQVRWCETEAEIQEVERLTYFQRANCTGKTVACRATYQGDLAAGLWSASQCFEETELGVRVLLEPNQTWIFAANVSKACRRKGIYSHVLGFMIPALAEQGFDGQLVAVNPHNVASNRVHQKRALGSPGSVVAVRLLKIGVCLTFGDINRDRTVSWNCVKEPIEIRCETTLFENAPAV